MHHNLALSDIDAGGTCAWVTPTSLVVSLGTAATADEAGSLLLPQIPLLPGSLCGDRTGLFLRPGGVTAVVGGALSSSGCVNVGPPASPPVPVVRLAGAANLGACTPLQLSAASSSGGGGRPLDFEWTVDAGNPFAAAVIDELRAATPLRTSSFAVTNTSLLPADAVITVVVRVGNFLGRSASQSVNVTVASMALPRIELDSGGEKSIRRDKPLSVVASAMVSSCGGTGDGRTLLYSWALRSVTFDPLVVDNSTGYLRPVESMAPLIASFVTKDPKVLRVAAFALQVGGIYELAATARMAERPAVAVRSCSCRACVVFVRACASDCAFVCPLELRV